MKQNSYNPDKIDLKILKRLQENGRITNAALASDVNLSTAPTLERVKKLEHFGFIKGFHAEVDREMLGLGIQAFVQITLSRHRDNSFENFVSAIQKIDEVTECYMLTGEADYMLKVIVKDINHFEKLITGKLSKLEDIANMKTLVILSDSKISKVLPADY